ncbi:HMA2 domain-containing protein [Rhodobacter capsulatus]|uniref:HMA2 domain-containing protein n=1 Tax=Rhodobacter capsulatus TaxID=1061 RepID=UPI0003D2A75A|nr:hypothetical protein [Rhodobacter capsulatus]ETD02445.1 hypothetical protein U714_06430 [Rhodobacter capsulatus DE442]ETD78411.1 hypothetical protein U717_06435 [Rhodobacter capsulatus R121]ETE54525.1 hypothetical protein U715_06425 [Rhodobacter capsulatus Y262]
MVCCVHHIPGRARFKIEALRRDADLAQRLHEKVGALEGVLAVEVNRGAASVIVHYHVGHGEVGAIMDHICAHCPKAALTRPTAQPVANRTSAPVLGAKLSPEFKQAMTVAMSKAMLNTFITRIVAAAI